MRRTKKRKREIKIAPIVCRTLKCNGDEELGLGDDRPRQRVGVEGGPVDMEGIHHQFMVLSRRIGVEIVAGIIGRRSLTTDAW